ncbi:MAG TPA: hypothetical protein VD926_05610 [Acidimicrobiales bacterium]|nr:hypothetical protein [Acidimicrobiales bacterium]
MTAWVIANAASATLVALPDDDARLFSISDLHGPSALDAIGAVGLVALWAPVAVLSWRALRRERRPIRLAVVLAAAGGAAALAVTILGDLGWWWIPPALLLAGLQVWVLSRRAGDRRARTAGPAARSRP